MHACVRARICGLLEGLICCPVLLLSDCWLGLTRTNLTRRVEAAPPLTLPPLGATFGGSGQMRWLPRARAFFGAECLVFDSLPYQVFDWTIARLPPPPPHPRPRNATPFALNTNSRGGAGSARRGTAREQRGREKRRHEGEREASAAGARVLERGGRRGRGGGGGSTQSEKREGTGGRGSFLLPLIVEGEPLF